jgi:hypothetical protein
MATDPDQIGNLQDFELLVLFDGADLDLARDCNPLSDVYAGIALLLEVL